MWEDYINAVLYHQLHPPCLTTKVAAIDRALTNTGPETQETNMGILNLFEAVHNNTRGVDLTIDQACPEATTKEVHRAILEVVRIDINHRGKEEAIWFMHKLIQTLNCGWET